MYLSFFGGHTRAMNETTQRSFSYDSHKILHVVMIAIVIIGSIAGNSIICLLLVRFKTLRTVPNILIVNLAVVDILNAVTNMPLMIMWYIYQVPYLKGRPISWFIVTWYALFMHLSIFNLTVLTMDRFGAIVHGVHYHSWKTINKAKAAVVFIWILTTAYTYGTFTLGLDIDLGDAPVLVYRIHYLKKFGRYLIIPGYVAPFTIMVVMGVIMWRTVHKHSRRISAFCSAGKQTKSDVKTAKTIGLTVVAFFCMGVLPMLLHNISKVHGSWPHFLAFFLMHSNSMVNPIIYSLKTPRFRKAFILFLKEPFGKSQPVMASKNPMDLNSTTRNFISKVDVLLTQISSV